MGTFEGGRVMSTVWTDEQKRVIDTRDKNLLVSAAAGSGKTAVLVARILDLVTDEERKIDIRTDKEIKLYSKRAELLTTHPAGSYELVKDAKGQLTLKITNPTEFWSVSRYLVIQVK